MVTEICGEDMVEKLRIKNVKTEADKDLEVAGIFIAVGGIWRLVFDQRKSSPGGTVRRQKTHGRQGTDK